MYKLNAFDDFDDDFYYDDDDWYEYEDEEELDLEEENEFGQTLCGIPIKLDESVPEGTIELRQNGNVIHKIEGLAIPTAALDKQ